MGRRWSWMWGLCSVEWGLRACIFCSGVSVLVIAVFCWMGTRKASIRSMSPDSNQSCTVAAVWASRDGYLFFVLLSKSLSCGCPCCSSAGLANPGPPSSQYLEPGFTPSPHSRLSPHPHVSVRLSLLPSSWAQNPAQSSLLIVSLSLLFLFLAIIQTL